MEQLTKWLNILVKSLLIIILASLQDIKAQTLSLEEVYRKSVENYPLTKQKDLIRQTEELNIENIGKGYWPQILINGQASYQSDVTSIKIPLPGVEIDPLSKDQYRISADLSQLIYDGGLIRQQQSLQQINATLEDQKIEVELYRLRDRITQLYMGILLLDRQKAQLFLLKDDLKNGIKTVEAQVQNGVALHSHLNSIKAEALKADQQIIELTAAKNSLVSILELFIKEDLPNNINFSTPPEPVLTDRSINRPELEVFKTQQLSFKEQSKLINAKNRPKTSAFIQGGYGRPALDMLRNEFEPFYIAGIRMNWSLSGLYSAKAEKKLLNINSQSIDIQKDMFILQTSTEQKQQLAEIDKWQNLVNTDKEIIALRSSIKESARVQLENGAILASDYLREVNAEDSARQKMLLHELQLLQAKINYANTTGSTYLTANK